jgi:hypothetical protein
VCTIVHAQHPWHRMHYTQSMHPCSCLPMLPSSCIPQGPIEALGPRMRPLSSALAFACRGVQIVRRQMAPR